MSLMPEMDAGHCTLCDIFVFQGYKRIVCPDCDSKLCKGQRLAAHEAHEADVAMHESNTEKYREKWHRTVAQLTVAGKRISELKVKKENLERENAVLRRLLWQHHGHQGLYGDDGEMQCSKCLCDFQRDAADTIEECLTHKPEQNTND